MAVAPSGEAPSEFGELDHVDGQRALTSLAPGLGLKWVEDALLDLGENVRGIEIGVGPPSVPLNEFMSA